jgi:hypothetical protein
MTDYFQSTPQPTPGFVTKPQQVPFATNPTKANAPNEKLAAAAQLMESVPKGLDVGGQDLQTVLRLRHEGAALAHEPGIPILDNTVEHTLSTGEPARLVLSKADGPCPLVLAAAGDNSLPATGGHGDELAVAAVMIAWAIATRRILRSLRVFQR